MRDDGNSQATWRRGLDGPALEIAATTSTPLRVCAGPGTGKTYALMRRVARLLEEGADPERIFVVTFTRTAASDLVGALGQLNVPGSDRVRAGTLHSYCFGVLQRTSVLDVTGRVARPMVEFEERFLEEDLKRPGRGVRENRKLVKAFEASWARLQHETPGWPTDPQDRDFHRALVNWLTFHQGMLLGELITEVLAYLRSNPICPERRAFDHVLVDEYQDLNRANQEIIDILAERATFTVIGDEDQSIYGRLQYAQPEGIRLFPDSHPGTHDVPLVVCRRCPGRVVAIANDLIAHNDGREPRTLRPLDGRPDGEVRVIQWETMEEEAKGLARFIKAFLDDTGANWRDVLVLAPRARSATSSARS